MLVIGEKKIILYKISVNLFISFSVCTSSIVDSINACDQREVHPDSEDGKDFVTTRLCIQNTCQGCYTIHEKNFDESCQNQESDRFNPDWENYKCCAYNTDKCSIPSIWH